MRIQSSSFFGSSKTIEVVNNCIIAKDGPNMVAKFSLANLNIKYDSVLTTKQLLKANSKDVPIMYGFLGTNVTFLAIIPTYQNNISSCSGVSNYIEYYFENDPFDRRTFTDILVLSGDKDHRIPQMFVHNPTSRDVMLDIMIANVEENEISNLLSPSYAIIRGLLFNSIRTDQIYMFPCTDNCTGSTQLEIYNINNELEMVIPFQQIDVIEIKDELITIKTHSNDDIKLYFVSRFNAYQALSRIHWVMESSLNRYLTSTYPGLDLTPPVITLKQHSTPQIMRYTNGVVSKSDIVWRFVDSIVDYDDDGLLRDGTINNSDLDLVIMKTDTGELFDEITRDGEYTVTFSIKDIAGNMSSVTKNILVDNEPPTIVFKTGILNVMNLTANTQTPGTITKLDIINYYIDHIWDNVDGIIPNSALTVSIQQGNFTYNEITRVGEYDITFTISDRGQNETNVHRTLQVIENVPPVIYYNFTGNTFVMNIGLNGIHIDDIIQQAINIIIDNHDGVIPKENVEVLVMDNNTPVQMPITVSKTYIVKFKVSDSSGNQTIEEKYLTAI